MDKSQYYSTLLLLNYFNYYITIAFENFMISILSFISEILVFIISRKLVIEIKTMIGIVYTVFFGNNMIVVAVRVNIVACIVSTFPIKNVKLVEQ